MSSKNKMKKPVEKVTKFTFEKQELNTLTDIELGMVSFSHALQGMEINKRLLLQSVYDRIGLGKEPEGITRTIRYSLGKNEIVVTDVPTPKEDLPAEVAPEEQLKN